MEQDDSITSTFIAAGQVLRIPDVSPDILELLVDWLYSDFKESLAFEERQALFAVSHRFDILELQQECERVLSSSVTLETYAVLADMARYFESQRLKEVLLCPFQCMEKLWPMYHLKV